MTRPTVATVHLDALQHNLRAIEKLVRTAHSAPRTPHSALRTAHSAPRTAHFALRTAHSAPRTAHCALRTDTYLPSNRLSRASNSGELGRATSPARSACAASAGSPSLM